MKTTIFTQIITALFILITCQTHAQQIANLEGINYQAVAIDEKGQQLVGNDVSGKGLYKATIGVRFTINNGPSGSTTYCLLYTSDAADE